MINLVMNIEAIPLDGEDLVTMAVKMGNPKTRWMNYDALQNVANIDSIFGLERASGAHRYNTIFILIQVMHTASEPDIGHWITLSFDSKLEYQYYDPYALTINQDLVAASAPDHFSRLLNGRNIQVNSHRHQMFKRNLNNCGRHTAVRAVFHFMNNDEYNATVIQPAITSHAVRDADVFVSIMTAFLSKSDEVLRDMFKQKVGFSTMGRMGGQFNMALPAKNIGMGGRVV